MINGIPQEFGNLLNSIILTEIHYDVGYDRDLFILYEYVSTILEKILVTKNVQIYCKRIPEYHILTIIDWCIYFNSNDYKCNVIMEKLVYILYYYIQDYENLKVLYKSKFYNKPGIVYLKELYPNIKCVNPIIKKLLNTIIKEVEEYVKNSRLYVKKILDNEIEYLPTDLINIIGDYIQDINILEITEMF